MTAANYQRILAGFQHGWAKLGNKRFDVVVFTPGHLFLNPDGSNNFPWNREKDYYIGEVRLPYTDDTDNRDNFTLSGSVYVTHCPYDPLLSKLEPDFAKSCASFQKLCHHAGAALPESIRQRLEGYCPWECKSGASWWMALIAHIRQLRVRNPNGVFIDRHTIIRPWLDSIRLIELLKLNTDAPEWFDEPLPQDPPPSDGPFGLDGFRWKGIERTGLEAVPHGLLRYLWSATDRAATYDELAEPVWADRNIDVTEGMVASARHKATQFFVRWAFPFQVSTSPKRRLVSLVERPTTAPSEKERRRAPPKRR